MQFTDDGKGIDPKIDLDTLFELGISYSYGTGVGLAQVKEVVEKAMGGEISIRRNESNKGIALEIKITNENKL
jgi:signal transduction histidine kinase